MIFKDSDVQCQIGVESFGTLTNTAKLPLSFFTGLFGMNVCLPPIISIPLQLTTIKCQRTPLGKQLNWILLCNHV
jgi:hypothetical protein